MRPGRAAAADTARLEALGGGNGGSYAFEVFGLKDEADGDAGLATGGVLFAGGAFG